MFELRLSGVARPLYRPARRGDWANCAIIEVVADSGLIDGVLDTDDGSWRKGVQYAETTKHDQNRVYRDQRHPADQYDTGLRHYAGPSFLMSGHSIT